MQNLENNKWVILVFLGNNSDTFRELIQNNITLLFTIHITQY